MAMLYINPALYRGNAKWGNKEPFSVILSVTDVNGKSLGNTPPAITLRNLVMSAFLLEIKSITASYECYTVTLVPISNHPWPTGGPSIWILKLNVVRGADQGETLVTVKVDS